VVATSVATGSQFRFACSRQQKRSNERLLRMQRQRHARRHGVCRRARDATRLGASSSETWRSRALQLISQCGRPSCRPSLRIGSHLSGKTHVSQIVNVTGTETIRSAPISRGCPGCFTASESPEAGEAWQLRPTRGWRLGIERRAPSRRPHPATTTAITEITTIDRARPRVANRP
jgi:hypothetical protein